MFKNVASRHLLVLHWTEQGQKPNKIIKGIASSANLCMKGQMVAFSFVVIGIFFLKIFDTMH